MPKCPVIRKAHFRRICASANKEQRPFWITENPRMEAKIQVTSFMTIMIIMSFNYYVTV